MSRSWLRDLAEAPHSALDKSPLHLNPLATTFTSLNNAAGAVVVCNEPSHGRPFYQLKSVSAIVLASPNGHREVLPGRAPC